MPVPTNDPRALKSRKVGRFTQEVEIRVWGSEFSYLQRLTEFILRNPRFFSQLQSEMGTL